MSAREIVVVDDHESFREVIRSIFNSLEEFEIVGEAADGLEGIECIKEHKPDLVLLDLYIPKKTGISVIRDIKTEFPEIKILAVTIHETKELVEQALEAGADGCCFKSEGRAQLIAAIEGVLEGKKHTSPAVSEKIAR